MAEQAHDRQVYEGWVRLHSRELYALAYRLCGEHSQAEDLVQECFEQAWSSMASLRDTERARGWLFQILRHRIAHHFQRAGRSKNWTALPQNGDEHPPARLPDVAQQLGDRDALQQALDTLSIDLRQTFLMVTVERLTCRETAEQLHIPIGTVLSRLDSARRTLRAALGEPGRSPSGGKTKVLR